MLTRMFYTKGQARFLYSVLPVFGLGLLVLGTPRTPQVPSSPNAAEAVETVDESVMPEYLEPDADGDWYRLAPTEPWGEPSQQS